MDEPVNIYPRSGPIRGLLRRIRETPVRPSGRSLFFGSLTGDSPKGTCVWCGQPTRSQRIKWHNDCVQVYAIANGGTVYPGRSTWLNQPYREGWKRHDCQECGAKAYELDHHVALSVAHELRKAGDPAWWRAWTVGNLRPLCETCHKTKTRKDRRYLSELQKGQIALPIEEKAP